MNDSTAAVPPAPVFGTALFALARLFAHQPHLAAIGYTLFALGEVVPHVNSIYSSTAPQLSGTTSPSIAVHNSAVPTIPSTESLVGLVNETLKLWSNESTVLAEETRTRSIPASQLTVGSSATTSLVDSVTLDNFKIGADNSGYLEETITRTKLATDAVFSPPTPLDIVAASPSDSAILENVKVADDVEALDDMVSDAEPPNDELGSPSHDPEQQLQDPCFDVVPIHNKESVCDTHLGDSTDRKTHSRSLHTLPNLLNAHEALPTIAIHTAFRISNFALIFLTFITVIPCILYEVYGLYIQNYQKRQRWFELFVGFLYVVPVAWLAYYDHALCHDFRYRWRDAWTRLTVHGLWIHLVLWRFSDAFGDKFPRLKPALTVLSRWVTVRVLIVFLTAIPLLHMRRYLIARIVLALRIFRIVSVRLRYWLLFYVTIAITIYQRSWWQTHVRALIRWVAGASRQIVPLHDLPSLFTAHEGLTSSERLHKLRTYPTSCLGPYRSNTWPFVFLIIITIMLCSVYFFIINNHHTRRSWFVFKRIVGVLYALVFAWIEYDSTLPQHLQSYWLRINEFVRPSLTPTSARKLGEYLLESHLGKQPALTYIVITGLVFLMVSTASCVSTKLSPLKPFLAFASEVASALRAGLWIVGNMLPRTWKRLILYIAIAWSKLHYLEQWKFCIEWTNYCFDYLKDLWVYPLKSYASVVHDLGDLMMHLGRSTYKWFKHHWVFVVLSVVALIFELVLYTEYRQIQRRFITAIETLSGIRQRTQNTIKDWIGGMTDAEEIRRRTIMAIQMLREFWLWTWHRIRARTAEITKEKSKEILRNFKTDHIPLEVPPPADEEPAFELGTQPEPSTLAKDCSIPKTLLEKHKDAVQNRKLWQLKIGAINPRKVAPKATFAMVKARAAVAGTIKAASSVSPKAAPRTQVHDETSDNAVNESLVPKHEYGYQRPEVQEVQDSSENSPVPEQFPLQGHVLEAANVDDGEIAQFNPRKADSQAILIDTQGETETEQQRTEPGDNVPSTEIGISMPLDDSNRGGNDKVEVYKGNIPADSSGMTGHVADDSDVGADTDVAALEASGGLTSGHDSNINTAEPEGTNQVDSGDFHMADVTDTDITQDASGTQQTTAATRNPVAAAATVHIFTTDSDEMEYEETVTEPGKELLPTLPPMTQPLHQPSAQQPAQSSAQPPSRQESEEFRLNSLQDVDMKDAYSTHESDHTGAVQSQTAYMSFQPPPLQAALPQVQAPPQGYTARPQEFLPLNAVNQGPVQSGPGSTSTPSTYGRTAVQNSATLPQNDFAYNGDSLGQQAPQPWSRMKIQPQGNHTSANVQHTQTTAKVPHLAQSEALWKNPPTQQLQARSSSSQATASFFNPAFLPKRDENNQIERNNGSTSQPLDNSSSDPNSALASLQVKTARANEETDSDSNQDFEDTLFKGTKHSGSRQDNKHQQDDATTKDEEDHGLGLTVDDDKLLLEAETMKENQISIDAEAKRVQENAQRGLSKENVFSSRSPSLSPVPDVLEDPFETQEPSQVQASSQAKALHQTQVATAGKTDKEKFAEFMKRDAEAKAKFSKKKADADNEDAAGRLVTATEQRKANRVIREPKTRTRLNKSASEKFPDGVFDESPPSTGAELPEHSALSNPRDASIAQTTTPLVQPPMDGETWWDDQGRALNAKTQDGMAMMIDEEKGTETYWHKESGEWLDMISGNSCIYSRVRPEPQEGGRCFTKPEKGDRYIDPWGVIHTVSINVDGTPYMQEGNDMYTWSPEDDKWREEVYQTLQPYARLKPEVGQIWVYTAGNENDGEEFDLRWDEDEEQFYVLDIDETTGTEDVVHYDEVNNLWVIDGIDSDWKYTRKMYGKDGEDG